MATALFVLCDTCGLARPATILSRLARAGDKPEVRCPDCKRVTPHTIKPGPSSGVFPPVTASAPEDTSAARAIRLTPTELVAISDLWESSVEGGHDTDGTRTPVALPNVPATDRYAVMHALSDKGIVAFDDIRKGDGARFAFLPAGVALFVDFDSSALLKGDTVAPAYSQPGAVAEGIAIASAAPAETSAPSPRSWKVACWDKSGGAPAYNGVRYPTEESARAAGADLASRWFGLDRYEVHPSDDEPNRGADGKDIQPTTPVDSQNSAQDPLPSAAPAPMMSVESSSPASPAKEIPMATATAPRKPARKSNKGPTPAEVAAATQAVKTAAAMTDKELAAARKAQQTGVASASATAPVPAVESKPAATAPKPSKAPKGPKQAPTMAPVSTAPQTTRAADGAAPKAPAGPVEKIVAPVADTASAARMAALANRREEKGRPMPWGPKRIAIVRAMRALGAYGLDSARSAEDIAEEAGILRKQDVVHYNYKDNELVMYGYVVCLPPGTIEGQKGLAYFLTEKGQTCSLPS